MKKPIYIILLSTLTMTGCARVTVDPIEVKPIHITMDITLRVDRSLDDFFGGIENKFQPPSTTQPSTQS